MAGNGIDGGVLLGRDETKGSEWSVEQIIRTLDRLGVGQALATSYRSIWFDAGEGNEATLAACSASKGRLVPAAIVNLTGYDPFDRTMANLQARGFKAVVTVSEVFGWTTHNYAFRALAREAADEGMPLQICVRHPADLASAAAAAGPPGGTVLLRWMRGGAYAVMPDMLAIGRDHPNIMIDVGTLTQRGAIEHMAARIGPDRLFISSNMPQSHAGAAWFLLAASELDAEAKRLVGGANLARVLGLTPPDSAPTAVEFEALASRPKFDTHWHTSGWNVLERATSFDDLSKAIRRYNLRAAITSSTRALSDDLSKGNEETAAFLDREPRALGLIVVNPLQPERSLAEIERWRKDSRFVAAKTIQDFYGLTLSSAQYRPILNALAGLPDMPIMAHLPGMKEAAETYPALGFIAAHSTWRHRELAGLPNVWFDIAASTPLLHESNISDLVAAVGADRVIFSSDAPLLDPAWTLGKIALLDLPPDALEKIFNANALQAFPRLRLTLDA